MSPPSLDLLLGTLWVAVRGKVFFAFAKIAVANMSCQLYRYSCPKTTWNFLLFLQYVLKPTFTKQQIANLDKQAKLSRAYDGTTYLPGIVGLNNIKANDYANAVLQVG